MVKKIKKGNEGKKGENNRKNSLGVQMLLVIFIATQRSKTEMIK